MWHTFLTSLLYSVSVNIIFVIVLYKFKVDRKARADDVCVGQIPLEKNVQLKYSLQKLKRHVL